MDGDFNVGVTDFNALKDLAAEKRKSGVSLTTLGFGTGNYNEHLMEQLADAGDIGAGHSVTALYEIVPTGKQVWLNESRYQTVPNVSGSLKEYGFIKLRYKKTNTPNSLLIEQAIAVGSKLLAQASRDTQWAVAVAAYGQ